MEKQKTPGREAEGTCLLSLADTDALTTTARPRKVILGIPDPEHEKIVRSLPADWIDRDVARRAARVAWSWRNEWSIANAARRETGRQLTKAEASRLFDQLSGQRLGLEGRHG